MSLVSLSTRNMFFHTEHVFCTRHLCMGCLVQIQLLVFFAQFCQLFWSGNMLSKTNISLSCPLWHSCWMTDLIGGWLVWSPYTQWCQLQSAVASTYKTEVPMSIQVYTYNSKTLKQHKKISRFLVMHHHHFHQIKTQYSRLSSVQNVFAQIGIY